MIIFNVHVLRFAHKFFNVYFLFFLHKIIDFLILKCLVFDSVNFLQIIYNGMTEIRGVDSLAFGGKLTPSHRESHVELA